MVVCYQARKRRLTKKTDTGSIGLFTNIIIKKQLLKDLQSLGNSAHDVDGWNLAFPFCQSCWLDKCFIHEAQGRKGCQRFKNILRNSLRCQASCQEALSKEAEVLHQPSWAINPLQRLEATAVVLGSHSIVSCVLYFVLTCILGRSSKKQKFLPWFEGPSVSPRIQANPIWRIVGGLEVVPARGSSFRIFPLGWQLPEQRESFKWQCVALAEGLRRPLSYTFSLPINEMVFQII